MSSEDAEDFIEDEEDDETFEYPTLISIDPGGTTGWNVMMVHPDCLVDPDVRLLENILHYEQGQFEGNESDQVDELVELFEAWDHAALLIEDFELRIIAAELSPVRITSQIQRYLHAEARKVRPLFTQMPSLAMTTVTDHRLKQWKLYRPGQIHARDSLRHAITFMRRAQKSHKLRKLAWPDIYGGQL